MESSPVKRTEARGWSPEKGDRPADGQGIVLWGSQREIGRGGVTLEYHLNVAFSKSETGPGRWFKVKFMLCIF